MLLKINSVVTELLDDKIKNEEKPVEKFKTQVNKLLENDFQCAICNEVIFRVQTIY